MTPFSIKNKQSKKQIQMLHFNWKSTQFYTCGKNSKMLDTCKGVTNTFCPHKEWTLPHSHQNGRKGRVRIFLKSDCSCRNRILKQLSLATFNIISLINHDSLSQILYSEMQHECLMLRVWSDRLLTSHSDNLNKHIFCLVWTFLTLFSA